MSPALPTVGICHIDVDGGYTTAALPHQPAIEYPGPASLDQSHPWISIGELPHWMHHGDLPHIKPPNWFGAPLEPLIADHGLDWQGISTQVGLIADIVHSAMSILVAAGCKPAADDESIIDAWERLLPAPHPVLCDDPIAFHRACRKAYRAWIPTVLIPPEGWYCLSVYRHPLRRAKAILQVPEPCGPWRRLNVLEMPPTVDALSKRTEPMLLSIKVTAGHAAVARVMPWVQAEPVWLTSPELLSLPDSVRFEPLDGWMGTGYLPARVSAAQATARDALHVGMCLAVTTLMTALDGRDPQGPAALWRDAIDRLGAVAIWGKARKLPLERVSLSRGRMVVGIDSEMRDVQVPEVLHEWLQGTDWMPPLMSASPLESAAKPEPGPINLMQALSFAGRGDLLRKPMRSAPPRLKLTYRAGRTEDAAAGLAVLSQLQSEQQEAA